MRTPRFRGNKQQVVNGGGEANNGGNQDSNPSQSDSKIQIHLFKTVGVTKKPTFENTDVVY